MKSAVLVIDFGTSNVRAIAFGANDGIVLMSQSKPYSIVSPAAGYSELDPNKLWDNCCRCVEKVASALEETDYKISAIGCSFMGATLIMLDKAHQPVYNCILSFDCRAETEAAYLTGKYPPPTYKLNLESPAAKILYMKKVFPKVFAKASYFISIQQFILLKLGLLPYWDRTLANCHSFFDCSKDEWDPEICAEVGISVESLMGPVMTSDGIAGTITSFGKYKFSAPIPVVIGGHDGDIGMVGCGLVDESQSMIGEISGTFDHVGYIKNDNPGIPCVRGSHPGAFPHTSVVMKGFATYGAVVEWFMREIVGGTSKEHYAEMWSGSSEKFSGGSLKFNPMFTGNSGQIKGLGITSTKYDLFCALIEALTFETRYLTEQIRKEKNGECTIMRVGGGPASSDEWCRLRADITGLRIERLSNNDISALGAAILAANAVGLHNGIEDSLKKMVIPSKFFEPNPEKHAQYETAYREYIRWAHSEK